MSSGDVLARAEDALTRHRASSGMEKKRRARARDAALSRFKRVAGAAVLIGAGLFLWGLLATPIGATGLMLGVAGFAAAAGLGLWLPVRDKADGPMPETELGRLPLKTEAWLADQRKLLPAPAIPLVEGIGLSLESLSSQLERLDAGGPLAVEARRLIGDDLPELVKSYAQVPPGLRKADASGTTPDMRLVNGLALVKDELERLSERIAADDIHRLATQGRYLELKYQGD
jgi:hypothetical protein